MDYKYLTDDDMAAMRAAAGREAETAHYRALLAAEAAKAEGGDVDAEARRCRSTRHGWARWRLLRLRW